MIESRKRRDRKGKTYTVYRVRAAGVDRTLPRGTTRKQAEQWETKVKQLAATGQLDDLDAGAETLEEFVAEWWASYAGPNLARNTLDAYAQVWNKHLLPRLGSHRLREIRPQVIVTLIADLERDGVGRPTIRKALSMLQGVLQRAVEWGRLPANPVKAVRKPSSPRDAVVRPLAPAEVEAIRAELDIGDATLVSVLAYSGPRPGEVVSVPLKWPDIGERTLIYRQPKTRRPPRPVKLVAPLAGDLRAWRLAQGRIDTGPVFPSRAGGAWDNAEWRYWRRYVFAPAAKRARVDIGRPYDLRHTWASLRLHEGELSVVEVAEEMGHSVQTLLSNYAHVVKELTGKRQPIEDTIRDARRPRNVPTTREDAT